MTLAHHDAARDDQGRGGETDLVGTQERGDHHVPAGAHAAVRLDRDASAQAVQDQGLVGLGQPDLPGRAGVLDGGQRAGAGAAVVAGDGHMVRMGLGDPGGHGAHADLGDQLDGDARPGIDVLQVMDELGQVLDRVDIVVRRRRDQAHARGGVTHPGDPGADLVAGQLTALAGLGALGDLDLDVVGVHQIFGGDAETPGGDLLDGRALGVPGAVRQRVEALGLLAALAGIGLAAQLVHGPGQGRVCLVADRPEGHGPGGEALDDLLDRLDLVERDRLVRPLEVHESAEGQQTLALLVDQARVFLVGLPAIGTGGMLELGDGVRGPDMVLAAQPEGIVAAHIQVLAVDQLVAVALGVPAHRLLGHLGQPDPLHSRLRAGEIAVHEGLVQAHRVEDLGTAIGLEGGDAHLGHDLQEPLADRLDIALLGLLEAQWLGEAIQHGLDGVEGEIGVDRLGPVTGQHRIMMDLQGRAGLHHEPRAGAHPLTDQVMVHGRGGQQGRDRNVVAVGVAVGQDQDVVAVQHGLLGLAAQPLQGRAHARGALGRGIDHVQCAAAEGAARIVLDVAHPLQVLIGQDRLVDLQAPVLARLGRAQADSAGGRSGRPAT